MDRAGFARLPGFLLQHLPEDCDLRACFLGANVCNLGFGVAVVQAPKLEDAAPDRTLPKPPVKADPWPNRMFQDLKRNIPEFRP